MSAVLLTFSQDVDQKRRSYEEEERKSDIWMTDEEVWRVANENVSAPGVA